MRERELQKAVENRVYGHVYILTIHCTGTLTFVYPGCLCCVYTAEPCSWDLGSVGLCSHNKKVTSGEL